MKLQYKITLLIFTILLVIGLIGGTVMLYLHRQNTTACFEESALIATTALSKSLEYDMLEANREHIQDEVGSIAGVNKLGLGPTHTALVLQNVTDFWLELTVLVIPQLPLTLGNAVVGTCDTAKTYFKDQAKLVNPRALTTSMGLANIIADLFGAMPMCHGSGGLTAHYKLGARTGEANLMIGGLPLALGLSLGYSALSFLTMIPLAVLVCYCQ